MSETYKIIKGVPIPPINRFPNYQRKYPLDTMEVGDAIFIPHRSSRSVSAYIGRISRDLPGKFSARHCWMQQDQDGNWQLCEPGGPPAVEGTGIWRTE